MSAFGFGIGVGLRQRRTGGSVPPPAVSTISALVVQGSTPLDPDGGGIGIDGNGWVAKAVMPFGSGAAFDPNKILLTVADPGFEPDGTATVRTRTIRGGAVLRRQYPNQAAKQAAQVGGNLEVWFSLEEEVYAGSTIVGAEALAGYHGGDAAGAIGGVANGSTLAYPKPLFAWLNIQHERATGTHFAVEAVAYHALARGGQQVACIEFVATDGSANASALQRAAAPALSDFQTKGQRVEAWKAQVPLANLAQGELCRVNAVVKPWIGDAWSVEEHEIAWPTANPQTRLRFLCDKAGTYGGAVACVKAGAAGGAVQATIEAARTTPFPTINAAIAALPAWNLANKGHNDHSGAAVWLMDDGAGGPVDHVITAAMNGIAAGLCWTDVAPDPANSGLARLSLTASRAVANLTRWKCDIASGAGTFHLTGQSNSDILAAFEDSTVSYNGGVGPINYLQAIGYWRNMTATGVSQAQQCPFTGYLTTKTQVALGLGVVMTDSTVNLNGYPFALIGCRFGRLSVTDSAIAGWDSRDGQVIANNAFLNMRVRSHLGSSVACSRGIAVVQNVMERAGNIAAEPLFHIGGEGSAALGNIVEMHNSYVGERCERYICEAAASAGVKRRGVLRFNLFGTGPINRRDNYTAASTATGRVGCWRYAHMVGSLGNVSLDANGGTGLDAPGNDGDVGRVLGEYWPDGGYAVGAANVGFANDLSGAGAGGGDYALTGGVNAAYARVPAGAGVLGFDLAGAQRLGDGSGAAGAYERSD